MLIGAVNVDDGGEEIVEEDELWEKTIGWKICGISS